MSATGTRREQPVLVFLGGGKFVEWLGWPGAGEGIAEGMDLRVITVDRYAATQEEHRAAVRRALREAGVPLDEEHLARFEFVRVADLAGRSEYGPLEAALGGVEAGFYWSAPPHLFTRIACNLTGWPARFHLVEKPVGLNARGCVQTQEELFRALGRETVRFVDHFRQASRVRAMRDDALIARLRAGDFEAMHLYMLGKDGINTRGAFFDAVGGEMADTVQNHLLQVLMAALRDPSIADPREAEREALSRIHLPRTPQEAAANTVRAQYVRNGDLPGYREEAGVRRDSSAATYALLRGDAVLPGDAGAVTLFVESGKSTGLDARGILLHPHGGGEPQNYNLRARNGRPHTHRLIFKAAFDGDPLAFVEPDVVRMSWEAVDPTADAWRRDRLSILPYYAETDPAALREVAELFGNRPMRLG